MYEYKSYPKVQSVKVENNYTLLVTFDNTRSKQYDCMPLLKKTSFQILREPAFFKAVQIDPGGYGISWNDDLDLSEFELWENGIELT